MTSPRASASGLPISRVISSAKSSARSVTRSKARRRISARSRGAVRAQEAWTLSAASSAARASSLVAEASVASTSPVAGSWTSNVPPSDASTHLPPISRPVGTEAISAASRSAVTAGEITGEVVMRGSPQESMGGAVRGFGRLNPRGRSVTVSGFGRLNRWGQVGCRGFRRAQPPGRWRCMWKRGLRRPGRGSRRRRPRAQTRRRRQGTPVRCPR